MIRLSFLRLSGATGLLWSRWTVGLTVFLAAVLVGYAASKSPQWFAQITTTCGCALCQTPVFQDDFASQSVTNAKWTRSTAAWSSENGGVMVINPALDNQNANAIPNPNPIASSKHWRVEFDFKISDPDWNGYADGLFFWFQRGASGTRYYGVELDTYYNTGNAFTDYPAPHISLNYGTSGGESFIGNHVSHVSASGITNGAFHSVRIDYDGGQVRVYLDGTLKINTSIPDAAAQQIMWYGYTGASHQKNTIDNVKIWDFDCPVCGDGTREDPEQCDNGASNGTACTPAYNSSCTYCSSSCTNVTLQGPRCGDGTRNGSEQCDGSSGTCAANQTCNSSCQCVTAAQSCLSEGQNGVFPWASFTTPLSCCTGLNPTGNVSVLGSGQCGNLGSTFVCTYCGDDQCEWNENECNCPDDCASAVQLSCGNGVTEISVGEQCDNGASNGTACMPAYNSNCTYCSSTCTNVTLQGGTCGDGTKQGSEQCDGAANPCTSGQTCNGSCQCIQTTFQCNDGSDNDGDGLFDLGDPGCLNATDNDEHNICPAGTQTSTCRCAVAAADCTAPDICQGGYCRPVAQASSSTATNPTCYLVSGQTSPTAEGWYILNNGTYYNGSASRMVSNPAGTYWQIYSGNVGGALLYSNATTDPTQGTWVPSIYASGTISSVAVCPNLFSSSVASQSADLGISMTAGSTIPAQSSWASTVTITNNGPGTVSSFSFKVYPHPYELGLPLLSTPPAGCVVNASWPGEYDCTVSGSFAPGQTRGFAFIYRAPNTPGSYLHVLRSDIFAADTPDPMPANAHATLSLTVTAAVASSSSSSAAQAVACGNGTPETGEECGETGLNLCTAQQQCINCRCITQCADCSMQYGSKVSFHDFKVVQVDAASLSESLALLAYGETDAAKFDLEGNYTVRGKIVAAAINGRTVTYGSPVQFMTLSNGINGIAVTSLDTTHGVLVYETTNGCKVSLVTVNGTTVTVGAGTTLPKINTWDNVPHCEEASVVALSPTRIIVTAAIGLVSFMELNAYSATVDSAAGTITFGTPLKIGSTGWNIPSAYRVGKTHDLVAIDSQRFAVSMTNGAAIVEAPWWRRVYAQLFAQTIPPVNAGSVVIGRVDVATISATITVGNIIAVTNGAPPRLDLAYSNGKLIAGPTHNAGNKVGLKRASVSNLATGSWTDVILPGLNVTDIANADIEMLGDGSFLAATSVAGNKPHLWRIVNNGAVQELAASFLSSADKDNLEISTFTSVGAGKAFFGYVGGRSGNMVTSTAAKGLVGELACNCASGAVCGNGIAETGEVCGESGLATCPTGKSCQNCQCVTVAVSSSSSSVTGLCGNAVCDTGERSYIRYVTGLQQPDTNGNSQDASYGRAVSGIGDFNRDGVPDVAVATMMHMWINLLDRKGSIIERKIINGASSGLSASTLAFAGYQNGDLIPDLVRGSPLADAGGRSGVGTISIMFLNADATVMNTSEIYPGVKGFTPSGTITSFGTAIANLGDLDGNHHDDLAVTDGHGRAWILFLEEDTSQGGVRVKYFSDLQNANTLPVRYGWSIASLGDIFHDNSRVIAVGAVYDSTGGTEIGAVHFYTITVAGGIQKQSIFHAGDSHFPPEIATPMTRSVRFGSAVAGIGDWNGDGIDDVAVGSEDYLSSKGAVWVLYLDGVGLAGYPKTVAVKGYEKIALDGNPFGLSTQLTGHIGTALAGINDIDGDGKKELLVGAPGDPNCTHGAGSAWLFFSDRSTSCQNDCAFCGDCIRRAPEQCEQDSECPTRQACDASQCACYALPTSSSSSSVSVAATCNNGLKEGSEQCDSFPRQYPTSVMPIEVTVADLNRDGKLDMVSTNGGRSTTPNINGSLSVFLGNGNGTFQSPISVNVLPAARAYGQCSAMRLADFNGDQILDMFVNLGGSFAVAPGNGNGGFSVPLALSSLSGYHFAIGDLNRDGDPDIVTVGAGAVSVYVGGTGLTFQESAAVSMNCGYSSVVVADFDEDGNPDVACDWSDLSGTTLYYFFGNGQGVLGTPVSFKTGWGGNLSRVYAADVDNDGDSDLFLKYNGQGFETILSGPGRTFSEVVNMSPENIPYAHALVDIDGDSIVDLVGGTTSGALGNSTIFVRRGLGNGAFSNQSLTSVSFQNDLGYGLAVADLDGNGAKDFMVVHGGIGGLSGNFADKVSVSMNHCILGATCQANCQCTGGAVVSSSSSSVSSSSQATGCGNGLMEAGEGCDDGNTSNSDGCSILCTVEDGWTCSGIPSVCQKCGNGIPEGTEQCDDGDLTSGDGCSVICTAEGGWTCDNGPHLDLAVPWHTFAPASAAEPKVVWVNTDQALVLKWNSAQGGRAPGRSAVVATVNGGTVSYGPVFDLPAYGLETLPSAMVATWITTNKALLLMNGDQGWKWKGMVLTVSGDAVTGGTVTDLPFDCSSPNVLAMQSNTFVLSCTEQRTAGHWTGLVYAGTIGANGALNFAGIIANPLRPSGDTSTMEPVQLVRIDWKTFAALYTAQPHTAQEPSPVYLRIGYTAPPSNYNVQWGPEIAVHPNAGNLALSRISNRNLLLFYVSRSSSPNTLWSALATFSGQEATLTPAAQHMQSVHRLALTVPSHNLFTLTYSDCSAVTSCTGKAVAGRVEGNTVRVGTPIAVPVSTSATAAGGTPSLPYGAAMLGPRKVAIVGGMDLLAQTPAAGQLAVADIVLLSECSPSASSSLSSSSSVLSSSSSVSSSSSSVPTGLCPNGVLDAGETCEIGVCCPGGQTCDRSCHCVAVGSSSSTSVQVSSDSSSSSLGAVCSPSPWAYCPAEYTCPVSCIGGSCQQVNPLDCTSGQQPEYSGTCGNTLCSGQCGRCVAVTASSSSIQIASSSSFSSLPIACGDGRLEGEEKCEVGIPCVNGRVCTNCACTTMGFCGDDIVDPLRGEECEQNPDCPDGAVCSLQCQCEVTQGECGNGELEGSEACESGHSCPEAGQICNNCLCSSPPRCGNRSLEYLEECEITDPCPSDQICVNCICHEPAVCGNGALETNEQCEDDTHCLAGQVCDRSTCRCQGEPQDYCGDTVLNEGEECEMNAPCTEEGMNCDLNTCLCVKQPVILSCGDAILDPGEDCDISIPCPEGMFCSFANCHCTGSVARCGDGKLEGTERCEIGAECALADEVCDIATCQCTPPDLSGSCGNGLMTAGEECEVGLPCPFGWSCDFPRCMCLDQAVCGDGVMDAGELCETNSACTGDQQVCDFSRCRCTGRIYQCGNGMRDPGEECDDGNTVSDDGCSKSCLRETLYSFIGGSSLCGNGIVEGMEECDDGNVFSGDGCSAFCYSEANLFSNGMTASQGYSVASGGLDAHFAPSDAGSSASGTAPSDMFGRQQFQFSSFPSSLSARVGTGPLSSVTITFPQPFGVNTLAQATVLPMDPSMMPYGFPGAPIASTGPEAVALVSAGAALGWAWIRRRKRG